MSEEQKIETHPVQLGIGRGGRAPTCVTLAAYEVYCKVFSPQEAMVTGNCRGGFGVSELVAFLYARSFPREEWSKRFDEAHSGLELERVQ